MSTSLELNRDLRTFTLHLEPSGKEECALLPPGVRVNLTVASSAFPKIMTLNLSDYNYKNTTEVVFPILILKEDLDLFTDEQFVFVTIESFSHIAEIEVLIFDESKSDLENCFVGLDLLIDHEIDLDIQPA